MKDQILTGRFRNSEANLNGDNSKRIQTKNLYNNPMNFNSKPLSPIPINDQS